MRTKTNGLALGARKPIFYIVTIRERTMTATAVKSGTRTRHTQPRKRTVSQKSFIVKRNKHRLAQNIMLMLVVSVVTFVFGYVNAFANLTAAGYNRSRLLSEYKQEQIINERLRVQHVMLSSPDRLTVSANKSGMIYANQYEYLKKPNKIAKAP